MTAPLEIRDPLTGVYSRAFLQVRLHEETERSRRYGLSFSLLIVDLDHFKSVNDAFGHTRGDQALIECAVRLQRLIRETDLIFRYGGDEFVLLLPHTTKDQALILAQRLVDGVGSGAFGADPPLFLSASIGLAQYPDDAQAPETLFERADSLHYEAKRAGRGRVVSEALPPPEMLAFDTAARPVERDQALKTVREFLERLTDKKRGLLVVTGPLGVGKSRFLLDVGRAASLQGYALFHLRGRPALRTRLYGALAEAQRDWPMLPPAGTRPEAFGKALQQYCVEREHAGLLVIVDDLADLDSATLKLMQDLLYASDLPVMALVCATELEGFSRFSRLEAPLRESVRLEALSAPAVRVWLRGLLKWEPPQELVDWLHLQTGGLPGFLQKALTYLVEQELLRRVDDAWLLSPEYDEAWRRDRVGLRAQPAPSNLPVPATDFIGREEEIQRLKDMLEVERLLTLVGPGGIGKSRLALQAAAESSHRFIHGMFFVPLTSAQGAARLAAAIAESLQLALTGPEPPEAQLLDFLSNRQVLLVLDNCEQLTGRVGLLAEILAQAPAVTVLGTSTERLNLPGEAVFELRGLPYPPADSPLKSLDHYAAVQLFLQSARRSAPAFELDAANAEAVKRICQLTEGMPLGIELAAAWTRIFSCRDIAGALEKNLDLLSKTSPLPGQPTSHRSVRAMLDYFWSLLSPHEQSVARRLSLFRGGFHRHAAQEVAGASPFFLSALVDRAFLSQPAAGRYSLHELLRQYAEERLNQEPDEITTAGQRHCRYFTAFLRAREIDLKSARQHSALDEIDAEVDNVRTAWAWALAHGPAKRLAECAASLALFYDIRGRYGEGEAAFGQAAAAWRAADPPGKAQPELGLLLACRAMCRYNLGLYEGARELLEQALPLLKPAGSALEVSYALYYLGTVQAGLGDYAQAGQAAEECLAVSRSSRDRWSVARALMLAGVIADALGQYEDSIRRYRESLSLFREMGEPRYTALALYNLGEATRLQGQPMEAMPLFEESLSMARRLGYRSVEAYAVNNLGQSALALRSAHEANRQFRDSLAMAQEIGDRHLQGINLCLLGEVAHASGDFTASHEHFCQALTLALGGRAAPVATKALAGMAGLLARQGKLDRAVELWARVASHPATDKADQVRVERELTAARASLAPALYAAAQMRGQDRDLAAFAHELTDGAGPA